MFRKVIHIALVMLLLTTSTGMTIYYHYCGSSLNKVSINVIPHSCCGDDCKSCHNETVSVKIKGEYSVTSLNFDFHPFVLALPSVMQFDLEKKILVPQRMVMTNDLPPPPIQIILSSLQTYRL